jgi:hypothetical protein
MRFYYFSLFSWMAYGVVCIVALVLLWVLWRKLFKQRITNPVFLVLVAAILVLPWAEELWIAYNFDRLCRKDAGVFINKTVEVEGYYNDTGTITRIVGGPPYKFIESPEGNSKYRRVEHASEEEKTHALAWYAEKNPRKQPADTEWITQPVTGNVQVTVEVNTGYAWRITKLDKPTARYHYRQPHSHTPVAHEITKIERIVVDSQTGDVLARETKYARQAYWFFIHLDAPVMLCPGPQEATSPSVGSVYNAVLKPVVNK